MATHRSTLLSFLRQRRTACQLGLVEYSEQKLMIIGQLLKAFDLIKNMDDWRQCREIYNQQNKIIKLLPDAHGKHAKVRNKILAIISHCTTVASVPRYPRTHDHTTAL